MPVLARRIGAFVRSFATGADVVSAPVAVREAEGVSAPQLPPTMYPLMLL